MLVAVKLAALLFGIAPPWLLAGVNALGLPLFFGDSLPIQFGIEVIYPSLVARIVFGASIGVAARR